MIEVTHTFGSEGLSWLERWRRLVAALWRRWRGAATIGVGVGVIVGAGRRRGAWRRSHHGGGSGVDLPTTLCATLIGGCLCGLGRCTANVGSRARPLSSFIWCVWSGAHNPGKGLAPPIKARLARSLDRVEINPNRHSTKTELFQTSVSSLFP